MQTRGQRALKKELATRGAAADLARRLGCPPQSVSQWVRGDSRPAEPIRQALARIFGIDPSDWLTAKEVERRAKLAAVTSASS